jgi:FtsP/CotA-like multicopper oxidase with cupredoxin domain
VRSTRGTGHDWVWPWRLLRVALVLGLLLGGGALAVGRSAAASRLPERYSLMDHAAVDLGGGSPVRLAGHTHAADGAAQVVDGDPPLRSVTELHGPRDATPDVRFTLTARQQTLRLRSGATVEAWSFNGQIPGPELRARQGDLVEVELINQDIAAGVTIHWHGVNVPNAEDGVAGATQDAVRPGGRHVYRFVATDAGTRWYHSHQQSSEQVRRGLFGALIVEPREPAPDEAAARELMVIAHGWQTADGVTEALGIDDALSYEAIPVGTPVRLRLLNADDRIRTFALNGAPFRVVALDGNAIHEPGELRDAAVAVPGGGRADLFFTMPDGPVRLGQLERPWLGYAFSPDGRAEPPPLRAAERFDPLVYGSPAPTLFGPTSTFDRSFVMVFDNTLGFYNGRFGTLRTINGAVHPDTPVQMVREGELIRLVLVNRSHVDHPMHLHGHHVLVLSRNGEPARGSPLWLDTVSVLPGETWEVAFRADNPGIWMDHCHNLEHVATGMMMHLAYEGVTTSFEAGVATGNSPE